jgi:hypothetical protein
VTSDPRAPGRRPGWQVLVVLVVVVAALAATIWFGVR